MVKVNCKTHGSDVERRDIWVDDWNKSNVDAVKASDFDALLTERDKLRAWLSWALEHCDDSPEWNFGSLATQHMQGLIAGEQVPTPTEMETALACDKCNSKGFAKSKTGEGCEFCDGTEGGVGP